MNMIERMEQVLQEQGVPQRSIKRQLSNDCGVSYEAVRQWFDKPNTKIEAERIIRFSEKHKLNQRWLSTGKGEKYLRYVQEAEVHYNLESGPILRDSIPLISWTQAGDWTDIVDNFPPGDADEWIETTAKVGRNSFALKVVGDSMTSPVGKSIPEGAIVIIDPDAIAENGSIVVAKLVDDQKSTLKKLVIDGPNRYLKPLNPNYAMIPINGSCRIVGVAKKVEFDL